MTKQKEKFLFEDDMLEKMHRKQELEKKIMKTKIQYVIFDSKGNMIMFSIEDTEIEAWMSAYSIPYGYEDETIKELEKQGDQCRQIRIKVSKKNE